jgi:AP-1 complex subunit gamma-1
MIIWAYVFVACCSFRFFFFFFFVQFLENKVEMKPRNVAKLLYIHMLGYSTQFGALEVIALCAAPQFTAKRIGYLALMLLLDEDTELLMMVTNSLRQDLTHLNQFVVGLALSALGNVGSAQMGRDLAPDVEALLSSPNAYIRKKAALCAVRVIRKVPDMGERYSGKVKALLSDKNHGVLLTGLQLLIELCKSDPSFVSLFKPAVPALVTLLKNLAVSGNSPEYEIGGICDPFLQVKLLQALRVLGTRDSKASDTMNDILAQVTTNTESLRNVGNAILYEAVQTILTIDASEGLRNLAINILGRFLVNRDNNIRYVALNTLSKVVTTNFSAVQRHRSTIVDCLKDSDISIRRRALDLVYALVNRKNIRPLVGELLGYLLVADEELRPDITAKLCMVTGRFAPSKKWHVDTILRVMLLAGQYIPENVIGDTVALVSQSIEVQAYAVRRFFSALKKEPAKKPLVYVAVWCLGEFGDLLIVPDGEDFVVEEKDVVELLTRVLTHPVADDMTRDYCLTALCKLGARFGAAQGEVIQNLFAKFKVSIDLEAQTRACEFSALMRSGVAQLQRVMDRVPPLVLHGDDMGEEQYEEDEGVGEDATDERREQQKSSGSKQRQQQRAPLKVSSGSSSAAVASKPTQLIDLDGLFGSGPSVAQPVNGGGGGGGGGSAMDLLSVLMPSSAPVVAVASASAPAHSGLAAAAPRPSGGLDMLLELSSAPAPSQPIVAAPPSPITVFDKNGVKIVMQFAPQPDGVLFVQLVSTNSGKEEVKSFTLLMAVPTYVKLQMAAPSGNSIPPNGAGAVQQQVRIENSEKPKPTLVKLKVDFVTQTGGKLSEVINVAAFPSHL